MGLLQKGTLWIQVLDVIGWGRKRKDEKASISFLPLIKNCYDDENKQEHQPAKY